MILSIPEIFKPDQLVQARKMLEEAEWVDGRVTAGYQSALAKNNRQLPENSPAARDLGTRVLQALGNNPQFLSAALPLHVFPPLFNRYEAGESFGTHVDNAIRQVSGTSHRIRTDLSATLFFSAPEEYDGGELTIEDTYGIQNIKLPAGSMILYPATSLHHVKPVTRGVRIASFFWIQSMVRDDGRRTLLYDLDLGIQRIHRDYPHHASAVQLSGVYNNLVRQWAEL